MTNSLNKRDIMFDNKQDHKIELIRNLFIAGSSAIPVVGGTLSVLLDKYLPTVRFVVMTVKLKLLMKVANLFGNAQIATIEIKTR